MIRFEDYIMPAASMGRDNPMPDIKNVSYIHAGYEVTEKVTEEEKTYLGKGMISTMLPYKMQDGYNREKKERAFRAAVLENDYVKAVFLPELGGRLWSLFDKQSGRELLHVNPVFQPGNLGLRNAWFSGGVEFNVGIKGHNPLTCSPLWCAVDTCPEGEILRMYEFERIRGVVYSISAFLPEDSKVLLIKARIENTTDEQKYMYWWSNIAVPETQGTRVLVPTDESFISFYDANHYILDKVSIPKQGDLDVTYPCRIPSSRDFFYKIPDKRYKWIATANESGEGILQCSTQTMKGRKLFVWGQVQGGRNWNEWLSEEGSAYIEIQAGLAHTQLEHLPMNGKTVWEWTEAYTALSLDASVTHGDYEKAGEAVEAYMLDRVGNPDELHFPEPETVTDSKIIYQGSGWGAVEECIRQESISEYCHFSAVDDETQLWLRLAQENVFPEPSVFNEPESYVVGQYWLTKLEALAKPSWYSLLHIGVIKYAAGDVPGAKQAWEASLTYAPSPWALRNLSMLYKNEMGDLATARGYILQAFELKKDCPALCNEVASQLTCDGGDALWLSIYDSLDSKLQQIGRLRFYKAVALLHLGRLTEAKDILNPDFVMDDIKEGELSVSSLWFELYRRLYAEEKGIAYNPDDTKLIQEADKVYPLPRKLDFRMHD
ncbi:MAG: DUF5107 domain-containing protein [Clostridia bacterium]|nr:DUF5107 domain-containing protein [Clostridia bacterium]